jgi:diguanylate cyclase (GGDEF)-like protein
MTQWREWGDVLKVPTSELPTFSQMSHAPAPHAKSDADPASLRVLLVDDDPSTRVMMEGLLSRILGHTVHTATNGEEALALAVQTMPQVVVTDWVMPAMDGLEFCQTLRASSWGQTMYVIMLTGVENEDEIVNAFEAGVDDYVTKPVNVRALRARLRAAWHYVRLLEAWERDRAKLNQFAAELAISNRRLEHTAQTDMLTELPNRRFGMNALAQAWQASCRHGQPMAVMLIDIDRFKDINDTYGHAFGDIVLKAVGRTILSSARKDDSVCRLGGEEFLVICRNTDLHAVFDTAERLRKVIESLEIQIGDTCVHIEVSIGVACRETEMTREDALVDAADKALYAAKNSGRNRSCAISQGRIVHGHPKLAANDP